MVFDRAYIQQGVCSPSRNSFLSGRRPDTTKIWNFKSSFRDTLGNNVSSLPGAFKNRGWITTGMGKVYHPGHPTADDGALSWSLDWAPYFHPLGFTNNISAAPDNSFQDGMITEVALTRLGLLAAQIKKNGSAARPFFMAVGLHKPHIPWVMPQRFLDMQTTNDSAVHDLPPAGYCNVSLYQCTNKDQQKPWDPLPVSTQQQNRRLYRAAMSWTDHNMGLILGALEELGLSDSTVVTFLGDHGWHLGEHGMWCKQSTFDLVARIPMLVHVPWMLSSQGARTAGFAEAVDLMPTLLELTGIAGLTWDYPELEGSSLVPLIRAGGGTVAGWKNATFSQYPRCTDSSGLEPWDTASDNACTGVSSGLFRAMGYSIRTDRWRFTQWLRWDNTTLHGDWGQLVGEELYDHGSDTGFDTDGPQDEIVNLATDQAHARIKAELLVSLRAGWRAARPTPTLPQ